MTMTVLNDSDKAIYHWGGGHLSPFFNPEIFRDGKWRHAPNHMNCGTGATISVLPAGQGFNFQMAVPLAPAPFRINMQVLGEPDAKGVRKATRIFTQPIDLLPTRIRDADGIVDISIYEEEWVRLPRTNAPDENENVFREAAHSEDYPDDFDPGIFEVVLVKRAVVTRVHKGEMKVGEKVEYSDPVSYPSTSPKHYRSGVEGEPRTLFFAKDASTLENGKHVMGREGHYSFSRVKGVIAAAFERELDNNANMKGRGLEAVSGTSDSPSPEKLNACIAGNDFVVDTNVYEQQWIPPTKEFPKAIHIFRAVVTGVHKGDVQIGTRLEYSCAIEDAPKYISAFRSVVEGQLETFFFSKEDATLKDGKYTIELRAYDSFNRLEDNEAAFRKELETNPELRGSYRAPKARPKE